MSKKNKKGVLDRDIISKYSRLKVPISVFSVKSLTTYEALILYLKDDLGFNYHNIGVLLARDERSIRIIYLRSAKKLEGIQRKAELGKYCRLKIPISVLKKRPMTTYEALILYLKDYLGFDYQKISGLLGRDERNVRTVYIRARKKNE